MPKVFNRALQVQGEQEVLQTVAVTTYQRDGAGNRTYVRGATVPTDGYTGYAKGCIFEKTDGGVGTTIYMNEGSATSADFNAMASAAAGGVNSWDELYDLSKEIAIDNGVLTATVSTAANGLYINKTAAGAGVPLVIGNSGTGNDLANASTSWYIKRSGATGVLELGSGGSINITDGALSIGLTATATSLLGTLTVAEGITSTTGVNSFTDVSNAAPSFSIINATATTYTGGTLAVTSSVTAGTGILATYAALTSGKGLSMIASAATTGTLVYLQALEGTLTGKYIQCYDGAADDFSVGAKGAVIITGAAHNNVFTVTAGDAVISDGSITHTDNDNANAYTLVNNTITTADLVDISSTSISTGSMVKINANTAASDGDVLELVSAGDTSATPTGLSITIPDVTTGVAKGIYVNMTKATTQATGIKVDMAALTTGTGMLITTAGVVVTTGELISLVANAATTCSGLLRASGTALSDGWVAEFTGGGAAFTSSGGMVNLQMGAATAGTGINITSSGIYTGTTGLIDINATQTTTGTIIDILNEGRTTGDVVKITTNTTGTGNYINCYDGAASDFAVSRYGAVTIAGSAIGTASLTQTAGDHTLTSGNLILTAGHIKNTPQAIVNANTAISIVELGTTIANNAASTHTLANGTVGQLKYIVCTVYTGDAVITPANFVGTTITLNAAGDSWLGVFVGTEWVTLALGGTAAVA